MIRKKKKKMNANPSLCSIIQLKLLLIFSHYKIESFALLVVIEYYKVRTERYVSLLWTKRAFVAKKIEPGIYDELIEVWFNIALIQISGYGDDTGY